MSVRIVGAIISDHAGENVFYLRYLKELREVGAEYTPISNKRFLDRCLGSCSLIIADVAVFAAMVDTERRSEKELVFGADGSAVLDQWLRQRASEANLPNLVLFSASWFGVNVAGVRVLRGDPSKGSELDVAIREKIASLKPTVATP